MRQCRPVSSCSTIFASGVLTHSASSSIDATADDAIDDAIDAAADDAIDATADDVAAAADEADANEKAAVAKTEKDDCEAILADAIPALNSALKALDTRLAWVSRSAQLRDLRR